MRIWIMSDLHLEFSEMRLPLKIPEADVCVVAGDVTTGGVVPSLRWLHDNISFRMPVVFVAGNHEFYGASFVEARRRAHDVVPRVENIHFLDGETIEIDGTVFTGGTLWTDFRLFGDPQTAIIEAAERMNDYRKTRFSLSPPEDFTPFHTQRQHMQDRSVIESTLMETRKKPLVVVTHHLPSPRSLPDGKREKLLSAAYASDLEDMILAGKPDLWIHGHVHERRDYHIGETRILANPRGYPGEQNHALYDAGLVVDI